MLSEEVMDKFLENGIVFHCPTRESYIQLMNTIGRECDDLPYSTWGIYKEETCVDHSYEHGTKYCDMEYYKEYLPELKIVEFPLVTTSEAQQDLKTLRNLLKKYHVCFAGNLEETIEKAAKKEMGDI